jgi:hypothetical protein
MLYFATKPDPVIAAIVNEALTAAAQSAEVPGHRNVPAQHFNEGACVHEEPHLALEKLRRAHRGSGVYRMSHSYWVLLFDCLAMYVARHNMRVPKNMIGKEDMPPIGSFRVGPIDLLRVVTEYFWDLWCFPDAAFDNALVPPPVAHRTRGGSERYAPTSQGLVPIALPKWRENVDATVFNNPNVGVPRYPMSTAPAVADAW